MQNQGKKEERPEGRSSENFSLKQSYFFLDFFCLHFMDEFALRTFPS
jgi:hypothetical protein